MIVRWILFGELNDPFSEFFIAQQSNISNNKLCKPHWELRSLPSVFFVLCSYLASAVLGQEKYVLRKTMVPSFIDLNLAQQACASSFSFLPLTHFYVFFVGFFLAVLQIMATGKGINFIRTVCQESKFSPEIDVPLDGLSRNLFLVVLLSGWHNSSCFVRYST
jgi:hypothetical protein